MVIVKLVGGLGNQFCQYVAGRVLAHKLNTELKLDLSGARVLKEEKARFHSHYRLSEFNILENVATPKEIKHVREHGMIIKSDSLANWKNFKGDIYLVGQFSRSEKAFEDIADIIRREFSLKKPFNPNAEKWRQKILSAECSVSMHFRHGDFAYHPNLISKDFNTRTSFNITPLDYYYTCVDILKQRYSNLTVFVFSDNMPWVKENLHLDVPTEFVEGCETDNEEWLLISLCKHNINTNSSFSETASSLNANPNKKIFFPSASTIKAVEPFLNSLTPEKKNSMLDSGKPISVLYDYYAQPEITIQPFFSLVLVVNNDAATIADTLDSLLAQDYKYYEIIIIDNASTDGSRAICRQKIEDKNNVTFKKLHSKVKNAKAWNMALRMAKGKYVSFLKGNDRFTPNTLKSLYLVNYQTNVDMIHISQWLEENANGDITFADKKFSSKLDIRFPKAPSSLRIISGNGQDAAKMLLNNHINSFLSTKFFYREFLLENRIKFEKIFNDSKAELLFQLETFFYANSLIYSFNACFIAPNKSSTAEGI